MKIGPRLCYWETIATRTRSTTPTMATLYKRDNGSPHTFIIASTDYRTALRLPCSKEQISLTATANLNRSLHGSVTLKNLKPLKLTMVSGYTIFMTPLTEA